MPKRPSAFVPYVYTREEIRRLLQAIEAHPQGNSTLEPATIRTICAFLLRLAIIGPRFPLSTVCSAI
jgi:hypothetical protein